MTKKDYEVISYAMNWSEPKIYWLNKRVQWVQDCKELAKQLHKTSKYTINGNKSFKTEKFLTACGLEKQEL
jgi:hypothetical protein|tara:strand:+ start:19543 stop:19755 length:213 start_codon:yes stop_codon:yes gene_type:complete